jgi:short-subunit dehydrogenase
VGVAGPEQAPPGVRPFALVTGGSSGIGRALAARLLRRGWAVELWARGPERLAATVEELGGPERAVEGRVCDVADAAAVAGAAAGLVARRPRVDLLVANAGIPGRASVLDVDVEIARRVMEVNYLGMVAVTRALWPALVRSSGRVVNVVSVAGTVPLARSAPYAASKHAALAWSRALAGAAPRQGVSVLTVNPGPVTTVGFPQSDLVARRLLRRLVISDEACAEEILHALDRGRREVFVPWWWRVPAVLQATLPVTFGRIAARAGR